MAANSGDQVRVGHVEVPLATAVEWVRDYTDVERNLSGPAPYAYPAYDTYEATSNDPRRLTDADLLAPVLLNVRLSIRCYYGLQRIREQLEAGLAHPDLAVPLDQVDNPQRVADMVGPLYAVLDDPATRPWGLSGTTLSKVLHRKAPHSLVLHDRWVNACYVSDEGPVSPARRRSWARYMTEVSVAIGNDIRSQQAAFAELDAATGARGRLTHVRLLDIVAWTSQGA